MGDVIDMSGRWQHKPAPEQQADQQEVPTFTIDIMTTDIQGVRVRMQDEVKAVDPFVAVAKSQPKWGGTFTFHEEGHMHLAGHITKVEITITKDHEEKEQS